MHNRKRRSFKADLIGNTLFFGAALCIFIASLVQVESMRRHIKPFESLVIKYEQEQRSDMKMRNDENTDFKTYSLNVKFWSGLVENRIPDDIKNSSVRIFVNGIDVCVMEFGQSGKFKLKFGDLIECEIIALDEDIYDVLKGIPILEVVDVSDDVMWPKKGLLIQIYEQKQEIGNLLA